MSERDTFGPRLRSERERRGISLETIAVVTNVNIDLWQGLERNDYSRWPTGIFARAFVRDYAKALGLDADEVVDEFCRLFPIGDRRAERVIRAQAELIGHDPGYQDESQMIPGGVERRSAAREADRAGALPPHALCAPGNCRRTRHHCHRQRSFCGDADFPHSLLDQPWVDRDGLLRDIHRAGGYLARHAADRLDPAARSGTLCRPGSSRARVSGYQHQLVAVSCSLQRGV